MFDEERGPEDEAPEGAAPGEPGESTPEEGAVGPEIEGADALAGAPGEGEQPAEEAPAEEPVAEETPAEGPVAEEEPAAEEAPAEEPAAEDAPAEDAAAEQPAAEGEAAGEETAPEEAPAEAAADGEEPAPEEATAEGEQRERRPRRERSSQEPEEEVIPGMHLEPDLVLEEQREESEFGQYAEPDAYSDQDGAEVSDEAAAEPEPVAHTPLDLAADARYGATGKRKSAVARVVLKPGEGTFSINGRHLDEYFPRVKLQRVAQQPLEAAGYHTRMDVVARIHGGGVAAQAIALRHGIARALVEADPALRSELKRRGYLTRDPRVKERKKAGLKKARKRPQFSKR
jgi:small subunit ribosomal protein S9